jgi:FixJ family two-component response regulator
VQDPRSVSIVDDDASLRVALTTFLRAFGFLASGFASVEEFETAPEYRNAACVVTDIQLPGKSGIDLKLHLGLTRPEVPVIMITARTETALLASARGSGAYCLLQKPFSGDVLVRCIEGALDRRPVAD